jgi:F420-dependent oxidoreductase-like protein
MKLGVSVAYWGLGFTKDDQRAIAVEAEALGYDSLWVAEAYGSDAVSIVGWLAAATSKIRLGTAIIQIPARPATATAMAAATIDTLSDGRFILGLGLSGPQVSEGWYGTPYARPLKRTREYLEVLRLALARERVEYQGECIQLPLPGGVGKALKLTIGPVQPQIPIYLATPGPKNVALTGEIADGWIPTFFSPEHVESLCQPLHDGARRVGRNPDEVAICPQVAIRVDDDIDAARDAMRPFMALYVGGMGPKHNNFYAELAARYGFGEEASLVQDLYLSGRKDEAAAALPAELIDLTCICGPENIVRDRLAAYEKSGVDTLILIPVAAGGPAQLEQLRKIAAIRAR